MLAACRAAPSASEDLETAERMAKVVVQITEKKGVCLPHELIDSGFTYDEVNRLWAAAKAQAEFEIRISKR
jgi:hypothetical protein